MGDGKGADSLLAKSWHDSAWIPILNQSNVMDYFSERSNPFYDRTCNNEVLKMQKLGIADVQLQNMQGTEFILLHVQEPILYVIRKQIRHSPTQVTPVSDYYIIAGVVYQAPDLGTLLNSRITSAVSHLQSGFEEARGYSKYHPSKGYWWDFGKDKEKVKKVSAAKKEEPSSTFQRRRVDMLLDQLTRQYPFKMLTPPSLETKTEEGGEGGAGESEAAEKGAQDSEEANMKTETGIKRERDKDLGPEPKKMKMEN